MRVGPGLTALTRTPFGPNSVRGDEIGLPPGRSDLRHNRVAAGRVAAADQDVRAAYLEGTLSGRARRRFEAHLAGCPHCTEYLAQMRETISLTGRLEPEDLTPQMRDEFTDLYRRWQSEQQ